MDRMYTRVARHRRQGQKGFTLIELLVVIAVLAILAAIVLFNVVGVTNRGKAASCSTDIKTVQAAVDAAINDNNSTTTALTAGTMLGASGDLADLATGGYLHEPSPPTTACTTLTLTFTNSSTILSGATVAGA